MEYHRPVLLEESVDALAIRPDGVYVDVTFGGGGHSSLIVSKLTEGKLYSFDQDRDAEEQAKKITHPAFNFVKANFRDLKKYLRLHKVTAIDGLLADLGVSSHQFNVAERGFSTRFRWPAGYAHGSTG
jgi:16S rRNA (cytosine1402-N4)-methyltransferase